MRLNRAPLARTTAIMRIRAEVVRVQIAMLHEEAASAIRAEARREMAIEESLVADTTPWLALAVQAGTAEPTPTTAGVEQVVSVSSQDLNFCLRYRGVAPRCSKKRHL